MLSDSPTARKIIYILGIAAQVAAYFTRALWPDVPALGDAFSDTANLLAAVAGVTALTNVPTKKTPYGDGEGLFQ